MAAPGAHRARVAPGGRGRAVTSTTSPVPVLGRQLAGIALGPLLLLQGRAVRRRIPVLPEPSGPREGVSGAGPSLRLLVTGDSAAAGVGVEHQDRALLGHLVRGVAAGRRVEWRLVARTGARTAGTRDALDGLDASAFDVAVVSVGLNDVIGGSALETWRAQHAALRRMLRDRFEVSHVFVCGLPPIGRFTALPQPLRWYLGGRAARFDEALRADVQAEPTSSFFGFDFAADAGDLASDGFHPGPAVYAAWGAGLAGCILAGLRDS